MNYQHPNPNNWTGRVSEEQLYLHEKIDCIALDQLQDNKEGKSFALLGYAGEEGVRRNKGRVGAKNGPDAIRKALTKQSNHLPENSHLVDVGNICCVDPDMEGAHDALSSSIRNIIAQNYFPIVLGGGHDLSFAHYRGIRQHLTNNEKIGIINLDAHFDLRTKEEQGNSGTPFYQIATELEDNFNYLCLGIQRQSNTPELFNTAEQFGAKYLFNHEFTMNNWANVSTLLQNFMDGVDYVYLTVDLDGFASSIAPGVSAPSPLGFSWEIAYHTIKQICQSNKLISMDMVELNPEFDVDLATAKLAAGITHHVMDWLSDSKY